jgi:hypothetical protein
MRYLAKPTREPIMRPLPGPHRSRVRLLGAPPLVAQAPILLRRHKSKRDKAIDNCRKTSYNSHSHHAPGVLSLTGVHCTVAARESRSLFPTVCAT